ncbi:hypothetical protein [Streptomyces sp. NPDC005438]|uniref:hypothetical protein n=1 Tax=Streptomyces sp. NPDC005438 TaxID=3156880 RepID=UPI0033B262B1
MPGDQVREEMGEWPDGGARSGPRHAAPRKPLLTRLNIPAGKAIALAAMPSAMLMSIGLTPQLASAKPVPKNPFRDGPCVSVPDKEPDQGAEDDKDGGKGGKSGDKGSAPGDKAGKPGDGKSGGSGDGGKGGTGSDEDTDKPEGPDPDSLLAKLRLKVKETREAADRTAKDAKKKVEAAKKAAEEAAESGDGDDSHNPLDPLGLGEMLKDLLGLGDDDEDADAPDDGDVPDTKESKAAKAALKKAKKAKKAADAAAEELREAEKAAKEDKGDGGSSKPGSGGGKGADGDSDGSGGAKGSDGKGGTGEDGDGKKDADSKADDLKPDKDGKKPFPCVEEKKVAGKAEETRVVLPNQPWFLEASRLALHQLDYEGVVNVRTANGATKQVLKFTAGSVDIGDLHQTVKGPDGITYHVEASKGSNSTIRGGKVTLYTEELKGNLFGLIPITFDPEHPPPLNIPEALFTNVKARQAGQFGGNLTVPGLHSYVTK